GANEESKTKIGVERYGGRGRGAHNEDHGGRHGDGNLGGWTENKGIRGEGEYGLRGGEDGGPGEQGDGGIGGTGRGSQVGGWIERENK
ncbi:hypothetical protein A2U01_0005724, partial [Trifolium medium]|nr:hypothetical protein [Trifolium medium]